MQGWTHRPISTVDRLQTKKKDLKTAKDSLDIDSQGAEPIFATPTEAEVKAFCLAEGLGIDYRKFYWDNRNRGRKINGEPIRDWKALARAWADKEKNPRNYKKADHTPVDPNKNPFAGYAKSFGIEL